MTSYLASLPPYPNQPLKSKYVYKLFTKFIHCYIVITRTINKRRKTMSELDISGFIGKTITTCEQDNDHACKATRIQGEVLGGFLDENNPDAIFLFIQIKTHRGISDAIAKVRIPQICEIHSVEIIIDGIELC